MSKIIHMISGPRNTSTAMMYSFDNRSDCIGIDEPFYGHYLSRFPMLDHPGRDEIVTSQAILEVDVNDNLNRNSQSSELLFVKDMAHHIHDLDLSSLLNHDCFLLVRDPKKILASFSKVIANPTASDIGIIEEWNIYQYLINHGQSCPIMDTDLFLQQPEKQLRQLCTKLSIPFAKSMLTWSKGPRAIDGCWARYWYGAVHESTGFAPYQPKEVTLDDSLQAIYEEVLPYYEKLKNEAIH